MSRKSKGNHILKGCVTKEKYDTEEDIQESIGYAQERWGVRLDYYKCAYCNGYHITRVRK